MTYASTILADSPSLYWRLGDSSGTTAADASGNGNTGTYSGGFTLSQTGGIAGDADTSVLFNGSTGKCDGPGFSPGSGDFSVEAWIKTTDTNLKVFLTLDGATTNLWVGINLTANKVSSSFGGTIVTGAVTVNDGNWHHVVVVRDSGTLRLYVDGSADGTVSISGTITAAAPFKVANLTGGFFFSGTVDEAAYYPAKLTSGQVSAHYAAGTSGGGATTATLTGPTSGVVNVASTNFSVAVDGAYTGTVTPATGGTGTFSPSSLTWSGTSDTKTFTYTPTTTSGSPHSISITASPSLSYSGSPISYTVNPAPATINVTDTDVFFSPYNWFSDGSASLQSNNIRSDATYAQTTNSGAYIKTKFTGTSCTLNFTIPSTATLAVLVSIDSGVYVRTTLTSSDTSLVVATGLSAGTHTLDFIVSGFPYGVDRWTTPTQRFRLTSITLDAGSDVSTPTIFSGRMLAYADSNGEGYDILATGTNLASMDASQAAPYLLGRAFDCEVGVVPYAFQGYTTATGSPDGVPDLEDAWDFYYDSASRLFSGLLSPPPNYIVSLHGENDGSGVQAAVEALVTAWRSAAPSANLIFGSPPNLNQATAISAGVTASGDADAFWITTGENLLVDRWAEYSDYHMSHKGHARYASALTKQIQAAVGGGSGGGLLSQRGLTGGYQ